MSSLFATVTDRAAAEAYVPTPSVAAAPGFAPVHRLDGIGAAAAAPHRWVRLGLRACLYASPAAAATLIEAAASRAAGRAFQPSANVDVLIAFSAAWIAACEAFRAAQCDWTSREHTGTTVVLQSFFSAFAATAVLEAVAGWPQPHATVVLAFAIVFPLVAASIRLWFRSRFAIARPLTRLAFAFAHTDSGSVQWELTCKQVSGHRIPGAILLEGADAGGIPARRLSTVQLARAIRREHVEGVLVSATARQISAFMKTMADTAGSGSSTHPAIGVAEGASIRSRVAGSDCLYLLNTQAQPAASIQYKVFKRAFDLAFAAIVLILGLPLFAFIALLVKACSRGPAFFVQDRVGSNGQVFRMYKFRTMRSSPACESDTRWGRQGDPRLTAAGRLLRKYSLDELPQFLNVLKGEMSIVGPRPERPFFVGSFRRQFDEYHRRHQLKVGITGWAQVNGLRGDTCIGTRLMYDLYYLQNWGLIFDLKIMLRTLACVARGSNNY